MQCDADLVIHIPLLSTKENSPGGLILMKEIKSAQSANQSPAQKYADQNTVPSQLSEQFINYHKIKFIDTNTSLDKYEDMHSYKIEHLHGSLPSHMVLFCALKIFFEPFL